MSHYEKLAIIVIRVIGCCTTVYALIGMVYNMIRFLPMHDEARISALYSSLTYAIVGVVLFALSKPLAALIAGRL
jgi:predicted MFS family arabinose efflux permease